MCFLWITLLHHLVCCLFSLWKWLEVLPDKPRQEDAHRLHQERDALRHGEVSGTSLSQGRALSHQISERRREAALPFTGGADERNGDSLVQRRRSFKLRWASSLLLSVQGSLPPENTRLKTLLHVCSVWMVFWCLCFPPFTKLSVSLSYLCFESSSSRSSSSKKHKVIKLVDITDIQKVMTQ